MIANWMIYGTVVSLLLGLAALVGEEALLRWHRPTRLVWAASLVGLVVIPLLSIMVTAVVPRWGADAPADTPDLAGVPTVRIDVSSLAPTTAPNWLPDASQFAPWDGILLATWLAASVLIGCFLVISHRTLRVRRKRWDFAVVDDTPVLLSADLGPAVVGFRPGEIVLPDWATTLPENERKLLLRHEQEHLRARDPGLWLFGLLALVLVPWNAVVWWQIRRLRAAIEVDCDARVLASSNEPASYGVLLLKVAFRAKRAPFAAAAFTTRSSLLERRVRIMTRLPRASRWFVTIAAAPVGAVLVLASCQLRQPAVSPTQIIVAATGSSPTVQLPVWELGPTDIPPQLLNQAEISQAVFENYPRMLKDARVEGAVNLWIVIDQEGKVREAEVARSDNRRFDQAAITVAKGARFSPALNAGGAVPTRISMVLQFALPLSGVAALCPTPVLGPPPRLATIAFQQALEIFPAKPVATAQGPSEVEGLPRDHEATPQGIPDASTSTDAPPPPAAPVATDRPLANTEAAP